MSSQWMNHHPLPDSLFKMEKLVKGNQLEMAKTGIFMDYKDIIDDKIVENWVSKFIRYLHLFAETFRTYKTYPKGTLIRKMRFFKLGSNTGENIKILIIYPFLFYVSIKICIISILHFNLEKLVNRWHPKVYAHSNSTEKCALRNQIYDQDPGLREKILKRYHWMRYFGFLVSSGNEGLALSQAMVNGAVIIVLIYQVLTNTREFSLDSIDFWKDYNESRRRYRRKLKSVIWEIIMSNDPKYLISQGYICTCSIDSSISKSCFSHRLTKQFDSFFVTPEHLRSSGYHKIMKNHITYVSATLIYDVLFLMQIFACWFTEAGIRYDRHIAQLDCERWNKDSVLIRDVTFLDELEPIQTAKEVDFIRKSGPDGGKSAYYLILFNIIRTPDMILYSVELLIFSFIIVSWTILIRIRQSTLFTSHNIRAQQVNEQLKDCSEMISRWSNQDTRIQQESLEKLEKSLSKAYINFEMFNREMKDTRKHLSFTVGGSMMIRAICWAICALFLAQKHIHPQTNWLLFLFSMMLFNTDAMVAIKPTNDTRLAYHWVNRLVGEATSYSIGHLKIIQLWRRQCLQDSDVKRLHGIRPFGVLLTSSFVINFNSYTFGMYLYLYQTSRG